MQTDVLIDILRDHVVIFDGAMGTELYNRHFFVNSSFDGLCLSAPDVVRDIHEKYVEAGAEVLTTNSFGANSVKLRQFGLDKQTSQINHASVKLAREASANLEKEILIAGSVGTVPKLNYGKLITEEQIIEYIGEQIIALQNAGADFLIFETLPSEADVEYAYSAASEFIKIPYVLSFSVNRNCESAKGEPIANLMHVFKKSGRAPSALGLNCGEGPEGLLSALEVFMPQTDFPVIVQPNAGVPKNVDGRTLYMATPEYLTTYAMRFLDLGVRGIGGCCGTGPSHINDLSRSIGPVGKKHFSIKKHVQTPENKKMDPVPFEEKSNLSEKLSKGEWVSSVEIVPPRGFNLSETINKAIICRNAGVDAINIPDGPRASSRMSPMVTAQKLLDEAEIEPFLHLCARDKNLIGMQSELLGCAALNIKNLLFITGDPPKLGDYPFASGVFDVDSIGMVEIQDALNHGLDVGGKSINKPTSALIAVGADPNAIDMEREIDRMRRKAAAGAELVITQPVFAVEPLFRFLEKIESLNLYLIAGIWPLASLRNAEFMRNEVPGVYVPDEIMSRMSSKRSKEEQKEEGRKISVESIDKIRDMVDGVQVSAPFGNVNTAINVIKG